MRGLVMRRRSSERCFRRPSTYASIVAPPPTLSRTSIGENAVAVVCYHDVSIGPQVIDRLERRVIVRARRRLRQCRHFLCGESGDRRLQHPQLRDHGRRRSRDRARAVVCPGRGRLQPTDLRLASALRALKTFGGTRLGFRIRANSTAPQPAGVRNRGPRPHRHWDGVAGQGFRHAGAFL